MLTSGAVLCCVGTLELCAHGRNVEGVIPLSCIAGAPWRSFRILFELLAAVRAVVRMVHIICATHALISPAPPASQQSPAALP